jgi:hypothetical protein
MPSLPVYSSYTYLIDAIRILGKVFECARLDSTFEYHAVDVVDQYLTNWRLHLPINKLDIVNNDGVVDEVLFQAHMVNAGSTIMLHRPRSNLLWTRRRREYMRAARTSVVADADTGDSYGEVSHVC